MKKTCICSYSTLARIGLQQLSIFKLQGRSFSTDGSGRYSPLWYSIYYGKLVKHLALASRQGIPIVSSRMLMFIRVFPYISDISDSHATPTYICK